MKVFGETLISVGVIVDLRDYDQSEIKRCYSNFISFMINAKNNGRKVSVVS